MERMDETADGPAAKRVKMAVEESSTIPPSTNGERDEDPRMTESRAGITAYIDPSLPGFKGIIKQRFTDFMVNEIDLEGLVCRITSLEPPPGKYYDELHCTSSASSVPEKVKNPEPSKAEEGTWPSSADSMLSNYFSASSIASLKAMWEAPRGPESMGTGSNATLVSGPKITTRALESKAERTEVHKLIRDLFSGKLATDSCALESADDEEDAAANSAGGATATGISVRWANRSDRRAGDDLSPEAKDSPPYIHFLLQKTNRDHQEAMGMLAQMMHLGGGAGGGGRGGRGGRGGGRNGGGGGRAPTKDLSVAGTKDKRAVTVQRVALKRNRKTLEDVWRLVNGVRTEHGGRERRGKSVKDAVSSRGDRGIRIAHLRYSDQPLKLGQLQGNEFTITLRNVRLPEDHNPDHLRGRSVESLIDESMEVIRNRGFINYYGMQRFGTGAVPTHHIGILVLKKDFKAAIETLFTVRHPTSPDSDDGDSDDLRRAKELYRASDFEKAYWTIPKNCIAERSILDKMRRKNHNQADWQGAFGNIPKTLRLMYVHAYQSCVWNRLVSERIARFGATDPVEGDLVFVDASNGMNDVESGVAFEGADDDDDDDARNNSSNQPADASIPKWQQKTKVLTKADLQTGPGNPESGHARQWTIYDVIVPLPGSDITVPEGWMHDLYNQILAGDGLTHADLTDSKVPEYQLNGSYRRMVVKPAGFQYEITPYTDPDIALTKTDEEVCLSSTNGLTPTTGTGNTETPETTNEPNQTAPATTARSFTALTLKFQLPSSSYATMLMREALKTDTSSFKHRQMTQKSEDQQFKRQQTQHSEQQ